MSRLKQVGSKSAFGAVANRKSQDLLPSATLFVIGHWSLGKRLQPCIAGLKSRLHRHALQRNALKFLISIFSFLIQNAPHRGAPKLLTPHSSLLTHKKRSFS